MAQAGARMHGAHEYLKAITVVFCVAAVTIVVFAVMLWVTG